MGASRAPDRVPLAMDDPLQPQHCAEMLSALAAPERLQIIRLLRDGPRSVGEIVVPDPATRDYEAVNAANIARNDAIGEFMNRPIFKLRSLQLD